MTWIAFIKDQHKGFCQHPVAQGLVDNERDQLHCEHDLQKKDKKFQFSLLLLLLASRRMQVQMTRDNCFLWKQQRRSNPFFFACNAGLRCIPFHPRHSKNLYLHGTCFS